MGAGIQTMSAPGVYTQAKTTAVESFDIRTDRSALIGYAHKGPANVAVKVSAYAQYVEVFGELPLGYLNDSAKSFFDNGGQELFVIRVIAPTTGAASVVINQQISAVAAAPFYLGPGAEAQKNSLPKYDQADVVGTRRFYRLSSGGDWGNDIQLNLALNSNIQLSVAQWQPDLNKMRLSSIANIEAGTVLNAGVSGADQWLKVSHVDAARQEVTLDEVPAALLQSPPKQVFITDLRLRVYYKQQLVEEYQRLGLQPNHSRYFVEYINRRSVFVAFNESSTGKESSTSKGEEPIDDLVGDYLLQGGQLNMATLGEANFAQAIEQVALEPEIALLAAPDIVYQASLPTEELPVFVQPERCDQLVPVPDGKLTGRVFNAGNDQPIANARIIVRANAAPFNVLETRTSPAGIFRLSGLPAGSATVSIEAASHHSEDFAVTIKAYGQANEENLSLSPIEQPSGFSESQVLALQQQLVAQAEALQRHYLILDPPASAHKISQVTDWRFQFDSRLASLVYPWLQSADSARQQPASALVMGALAGRDLQQGLIYATANLPLVTTDQLLQALSAPEHGRLNEAHINCLLVKPGSNIHLMGARTLSFDRPWRYISSVRLMLFIIQFLQQRMQWAAFEPNNQLLRIAVAVKLTSLLEHLWHKGALRGDSARAAYTVICDDSNNTEATMDNGQLIAEIGIAVAEPQEFIWLTYQRQADQSNISVS